jgi:hypothetical protein
MARHRDVAVVVAVAAAAAAMRKELPPVRKRLSRPRRSTTKIGRTPRPPRRLRQR